MGELIGEILELRTKERELRVSIKKLRIDIEEMEEKVQFEETTLEDDLSTAQDDYLEEKHEVIKEKYAPNIAELEEEIAELSKYMDSEEVEEDEDLAKARETKEYLNTAAKIINRYHEELKKISTPYFIDLAYTEKSMRPKQFRRTFKTIPRRIQNLEDMRLTITQPFQFIDNVSTKKGVNHTIYLTATTLSWWVAGAAPIALIKSVRRAKFLHNSSVLYHELMHTLVIMQRRTDEEIAAIFKNLLKLKGQQTKEILDSKTSELESLSLDLEEALQDVKFDEDAFRRKVGMKIASLNQQLGAMTVQYEMMEEQIEEVRDELERLTGERSLALQVERESYLKRREVGEVVMPTRLLYDYTPDSNSYFNITPGLYLYNDSSIVDDFLQMFIFQLRNVMDWGSVQFRILDLLGASFASPLMLKNTGKAKSQDILVYTLKEERDQVTELMHDLLVRRKIQILQSVENIGDYNLIQKRAGSAPMPYQMIFIVLTDIVQMEEKLIQLIHNGEQLGLMVHIFMKEELFSLQMAKTVEPYFKAVIELTDTGLSAYDPEEYVSILEQQEADRKSRT